MFYNKYLIFGKYMDNFRENKFFALFFQKMGFWDFGTICASERRAGVINKEAKYHQYTRIFEKNCVFTKIMSIFAQ